jgi:hypothetical protein
MYPSSATAKLGYRWDNRLSSDFALAADLNPGVGGGQDVTLPVDRNASSSIMKRANSPNHNGVGQDVMYGDGHVSWEFDPFVGVNHDNVYTVSGSTDGTVTTSKVIVGSPNWPGDSVLLPVRK